MKFHQKSDNLSIIIPALNEEEHLPHLLKSLIEQTTNDFEVIVSISPETTDATESIAKEFGARVVEGGRQARARNNGAKAAHGKHYFFLDADTRLHRRWFLEKTLPEFDTSKFDLANFPWALTRECYKASFVYIWLNIVNSLTINLKKPLGGSGGLFLTYKDAFHAVGGFNENARYLEDADFVAKYVKQGYRYGYIRNSIYVSPRAMRSYRGIAKTMKRYVYNGLKFKAGKHEKGEFIQYWRQNKSRDNS